MRGTCGDILLLADATDQLVPAEGHQNHAADNQRDRAEEAARGEVAL